MRIKVGNQWFKVAGEQMLLDNQKHFAVEHKDNGGNSVHGLIPWWLVDEICTSNGDEADCNCSSCHSLWA